MTGKELKSLCSDFLKANSLKVVKFDELETDRERFIYAFLRYYQGYREICTPKQATRRSAESAKETFLNGFNNWHGDSMRIGRFV